MNSTCACGHEAAAHAHYRPGSECSACDACTRFRVGGRVNRIVRGLRVLLPVAVMIAVGWAAAPWLPHP